MTRLWAYSKIRHIVPILAILLAYLPLQAGPVHAYSFSGASPVVTMGGVLNDVPAVLQEANGTIWLLWRNFNVRSDIYYITNSGGGWSSPTALTGPSTSSFNTAPAVVQLQNGTIIFAWATNVTGSLNIFYKTLTGKTWSSPRQLTSGAFTDTPEAMTVGSDGKVWLIFQRQTQSSSCPISGFCRQIYYKTLLANVWTADTQLTSDATWNMYPGGTYVRGSGVWVSYAKYSSSNADFTIYYQVYNGSSWSTATQLTSPFMVSSGSEGDTHPNMLEDRNGTIWLFWSREMPLGGGAYEDNLWYQSSGDAGNAWGSAAQLTSGGNSTNPLDDTEPAAIQGLDKSLWIFYSSDTFTGGSAWYINLIKTSPIYPVAAVAVTSLKVSPYKMYPWGYWAGQAWKQVSINVTVTNTGDYLENIQLTVQAVNKTSYIVGTGSGFLPGGSSITFYFTWNASATAAPSARYKIIASLPLVQYETLGSFLTNTMTFKTLYVLIPGDLNQVSSTDFCVDVNDLSAFLSAYASTPSSPKWNPNADINRDGVVDVHDLSTFLSNYAKCI